MSAQQNQAVHVRWINAMNEGNLEKLDQLADEIYASTYILHDPDVPDLPPGPAGIKQYAHSSLADISNMHITIEDTFAAGDRVATRCTVRGMDVSQNKAVTFTLMSIIRFGVGKIAEEWELFRLVGG